MSGKTIGLKLSITYVAEFFCTKSPDFVGFRKEISCQEFLTKLTAGSGKACSCGHQCTSIMQCVCNVPSRGGYMSCK